MQKNSNIKKEHGEKIDGVDCKSVDIVEDEGMYELQTCMGGDISKRAQEQVEGTGRRNI